MTPEEFMTEFGQKGYRLRILSPRTITNHEFWTCEIYCLQDARERFIGMGKSLNDSFQEALLSSGMEELDMTKNVTMRENVHLYGHTEILAGETVQVLRKLKDSFVVYSERHDWEFHVHEDDVEEDPCASS